MRNSLTITKADIYYCVLEKKLLKKKKGAKNQFLQILQKNYGFYKLCFIFII